MRYILSLIIPAALLMLASCDKELGGSSDDQSGSIVSFVLGNDDISLKSGGSQVASYDIDNVGVEGLALVETVSSMDGMFCSGEPDTKSTPVYNTNFDALYSSQLYATAYEPKEGTVELTDVWGSYLENHGTVPLKKKEDEARTYYYDYSKGQDVNLHWPEGGSLLFFLQAPYDATKSLKPDFYSNGSIQFDYTDPGYVSGNTTIANAATSQKDILFASTTKSQSGGSSTITMYHALAGVKFKLGNADEDGVSITKVTFKDIYAGGHCTITPQSGKNSSVCSVWTNLNTKVNYSQTFSGVVTYQQEGSSFPESFFKTNTYDKNLGKTDGSEIMMMVPQVLKDVKLEIEFTITKNGTTTEYTRTFTMNSTWKAGELHTYQITVTVPTANADVMLVLDVSGAMKNQEKITNLKAATKAFIQKLAKTECSISIISFQAEDTKNHTKNNFGTEFVSVAEKQQALSTLVDNELNLTEKTVTIERGVNLALDAFNNRTVDHDKYCIILTGGLPGTKDKGDYTVAQSTWDAAYSIKKLGVTIFTIYLGSEWLTTRFSKNTDSYVMDVENFLDGVSSNFPKAKWNCCTSTKDAINTFWVSGERSKGKPSAWRYAEPEYRLTKTVDKYYIPVPTTSDLTAKFEEIAQEITK